jgi:hypothetical protein
MTPVLTSSMCFQPPACVFNPHHTFLTPHHLFCTLGTRICMFLGFFSSFFFFFFFLCTPGTCICVFLGFSLLLCTPGTCRRVFPGLVFYFIYFLSFPCTRNTAYHVSGAFFCLFSFFAPLGHAYVCFGGLFYLCTLGHALYACLQGFFLLFYFLFFFAPQQPVLTSRHALQTPRHVFQTHGSLF